MTTLPSLSAGSERIHGDRTIAALQGVGALLGVYAVLVTFETDGFGLDSALYGITPLGLAVTTLWQAVQLWQRKPGALTAMQCILVAQIPWLNLHGRYLHYDFSLLGAIVVRWGDAEEPLELMLGTRWNVSSALDDPACFGINVLAAYLVAHLTWSRRKARARGERRNKAHQSIGSG